MSIKVCVAGVTGWVGRDLVPAVEAAEDLELVGAVSRSAAGKPLVEVLQGCDSGVIVQASVADALAACRTDVLIDYTLPEVIRDNTLTALRSGVGVVIGATGMIAADYEEIDRVAEACGRGAVSGNFSLTASLMMHLAVVAAEHLPSWEILDFAAPMKLDAPSGTATELAERLGEVHPPQEGRPVAETLGPDEVRGAVVGGSRVHSVRLPSYTLSCEAVFGLPDERLTIRHDAGTSALPYVAGTLIAARKLPEITGLVRGLDKLLFD